MSEVPLYLLDNEEGPADHGDSRDRSVSLPLFLSLSLSFSLSLSLSRSLSLSLRECVCVRLSLSLSLRVCLCVCDSLSLSLSLRVCVYMCVCVCNEEARYLLDNKEGPADHGDNRDQGPHFFFFFVTLVTGPRKSLSLKLSDSRVYEPQLRARLGTTAHFCEVVVLKVPPR